MRRFRFLAAGLSAAALAALVTACGSSPANSSSPVPPNIQHRVHDEYGSIGFIPTQVPHGYVFQNWDAEGPAGFNMYFGLPNLEQIGFGVDVVSCKRNGRPMHTFKANGVNVQWSATYEDQQAWRCLTVNGKQVLIQASRSVSGDDSLHTPQQRQDAEQMVSLVAHVQVAP